MQQEQNLCDDVIAKCRECGIDSEVFLREKLLELEERKRILLTPTKTWFNANRLGYNGLAERLLGRELTEGERYDQHDGLASWIARRLNPEQREADVDLSTKRLLLKESNGCCDVCGVSLSPETVQVDHKTPLAEGGSNHTLNFQPLCLKCNQGKRDYFEVTAPAAARPWYEPRGRLINGKVELSSTKRFCVLRRDGSTCQKCGAKASDKPLTVIPRVLPKHGGQLVYDNLLTCCVHCSVDE